MDCDCNSLWEMWSILCYCQSTPSYPDCATQWLARPQFTSLCTFFFMTINEALQGKIWLTAVILRLRMQLSNKQPHKSVQCACEHWSPQWEWRWQISLCCLFQKLNTRTRQPSTVSSWSIFSSLFSGGTEYPLSIPHTWTWNTHNHIKFFSVLSKTPDSCDDVGITRVSRLQHIIAQSFQYSSYCHSTAAQYNVSSVPCFISIFLFVRTKKKKRQKQKQTN